MYSALFVLAHVVFGSKMTFNSNVTLESGKHMVDYFVQHVSATDRGEDENMFHQHFPEADVSFDVTITGEDVTAKNVFFMVQETKDFNVSCDPYRSIGRPVLIGNNTVRINDTKIIDFDGFAAAYVCAKSGAAGKPIQVQGDVIFKNKHGYIESGYFDYILFELCLALVYVYCVIKWLFTLSKWRENVMFFHKLLTVIAVISCLDEFMKLYYLDHENKYDTHEYYLTIFSKIFHATKTALVRYLGLMLGFGWGMVHMKVPEKPQILLFSIAYGCMFLAQTDDKKNLRRSTSQLGIVIALCVMDAIWATLIVSKIDQLCAELENNNQTVKAKHYKKFSKLSSWSVILGTIFCAFSIFFFRTNWRVEKFSHTWWFNYGCWKVMALLVLMSAMYLFKPHQASKLYATATQLKGDASDDELDEPNLDDEAEQTLIPQ